MIIKNTTLSLTTLCFCLSATFSSTVLANSPDVLKGNEVPLSSKTISQASENIFLVNRANINIKASPKAVWRYLPGIQIKEGVTYQSLNPLEKQAGAEYLLITKNEKGEITNKDQYEILHYEPGVRFVAKVTYLPPMPAFNIFYNVELTEQHDGSTQFIMDAYSWVNTEALLGTKTIDLKTKKLLQIQSQQTIDKSYQLLKERIEAQVK